MTTALIGDLERQLPRLQKQPVPVHVAPQQDAGVLRATARDDFTFRLRGADTDCYGETVQPAPTIDASR